MTAPKTATKAAPKSSTAKTAEVMGEVAEAARVAHETLRAALAAFQAEMPTIRKGQTASVRSDKGNYTYDYADLSDVTEKAMPLLGRHGLFFSTRPTLVEGTGFALQYELGHESDPEGERALRGVYPLPSPSNPQAMGSAITYARRYVLCAVTGIAPGGDDDDASLAQYSAPAPRPASRGAARPAAAPAAPRRNFAAEASEAAGNHARLTALWQEARAAQEPVDVLDGIAALGRAAAPAPDEAPEPDEARDPGNPEDEAPADVPAEAAA